ncbi:MAG: alanine racemase [Amnibacterium sp.]
MAVPALPVIDPSCKSFPPSSWGTSGEAFLAGRPRLSAFQTPLLTLDRGAVQHNTRVMAEWAAAAGLQLAPHGKTSMSPQLWRMLADAGAWGLTLATPWQVQVARSVGVSRILLANELVDPVAVGWLRRELAEHPEFEFVCWADSLDAVAALEAAMAGTADDRPIDVLVELGGRGGRTGARTVPEALAVADAIAASPRLRLAGVGGYEGALAHGHGPEGDARVRAYLEALVGLHRRLEAAGSYEGRRPIVTAGGSAYFDLVAEAFASLRGSATLLLRSGAYQFHDDGYYADTSPLGLRSAETRLRPALALWARVLSRPEPDLAILDAGRRDAPFDEGLPVPQRIRGLDAEGSAAVLAGSRVVALNDQHAFLRLGEQRAAGAELRVGDVVRLGISHPCTALDKWRLIPVVDSQDAEDPAVVDLVTTIF